MQDTRTRRMLDILLVAAAKRVPCEALVGWLPMWRAAQTEFAGDGPFAASVGAALGADRLAWAFFSGYQGAIQAVFPDVATMGRVSALCVHETGRKITEVATTVQVEGQDLHLSGMKSWALAGVNDTLLLVLARRSDGPQKGPGSLAIARLESGAAGVRPGTPRPQNVVPELPHAALHFDSVWLAPEQLMPSDGYAEYAKPFRVFEDIFVTGCTLAYLLAESDQGNWPTTWRQRCIAAIAMLGICAGHSAHDARALILVAGALAFAGDVIRESDALWLPAQMDAHARWLRDRPILSLGKEARRQRIVGSWSRENLEAVGPRQER